MNKVTRELLRRAGTCYGAAREKELIPVDGLSIREVAALDIPAKDKVWFICRASNAPDNALREFACWCARNALNAERKDGREPDPRSWRAVDVAERYARGEASQAELDAASADAYNAARFAARAAYEAAFYAASNAACYAASNAAWNAASNAAYNASNAAYNAYEAAYNAACYAASNAACYAACYAAYSTACDAAYYAANATSDAVYEAARAAHNAACNVASYAAFWAFYDAPSSAYAQDPREGQLAELVRRLEGLGG